MSGFSPEWLKLREPVDHRARDQRLAAKLAARFTRRETVRIVDLGCGAGSNIRATALLLGDEQDWTLVDYDPRLLDASRTTLPNWADSCEAIGDALLLRKGPRSIRVRFRQADLNQDLDAALGEAPDLVTASALFDLCSAAFLERLAAAMAARKAAFYTVLTYNGIQTWTPAQSADAAMAAAFHRHQMTDKGFGASAGPSAPAVLKRVLEAADYTVEEGDSPWVLGSAEQQVIDDLAAGFAAAVSETGDISAATIEAWRAVQRTGAVVGHTDTLAFHGD